VIQPSGWSLDTDYAMPRAADAPEFVFDTRNVPCKTNPLGVKGAGEAGAIGHVLRS
jgi:aerobic carbon-monoxide dehydrogenase large subunit